MSNKRLSDLSPMGDGLLQALDAELGEGDVGDIADRDDGGYSGQHEAAHR